MSTFLGCSKRNSLSDIIKRTKGKLFVDWKKLADVEANRHDARYEKLIDRLLNENVLSFSEENTYAIWGGGMDASPLSQGLIRAYFPRKEDAIAYAKARYGRAEYTVRIVQFAGRIKGRR